MKKQLIATLIVIITLTIPFLNFKYKEADESLLTVQQQFHTGLINFEQSIAQFNELAQNFDASEASIQKLQAAHLNNRLAFKQIELFLEYYERFAVVKNLNGAPLPKTEPAVAEVLIVNPTGLQVLDELVFAEHPYEERKEIQKHAMNLVGSYQEIKDYQMEVAMTHRHVFEAARQELVRIFTLGVTGFDTPGSVNALPEAAAAMQSISDAIHAYYPLVESKNLVLVKEIKNTFNETIDYLETNNDFDSFDRLTFLKKYINPLYKLLYEFHLATGVETIAEVNPQPLPFNYDATNIFGDDFLNVEYFAQLDLDDPSSNKRIELGKLLFFDPILSSTNDRSCASGR
ncbi:MAG: hypothetical protein AAF599_05590 [Bacteroidota bacterium]